MIYTKFASAKETPGKCTILHNRIGDQSLKYEEGMIERGHDKKCFSCEHVIYSCALGRKNDDTKWLHNQSKGGVALLMTEGMQQVADEKIY